MQDSSWQLTQLLVPGGGDYIQRHEEQNSGCKSTEFSYSMCQPSWDTTCTSPRAPQVPGTPFIAGLGSSQHFQEPLDCPHTMAKPLSKATSTAPGEVSGVQSGGPMEICQTTSEWSPVTFYSQAPSSSPADMKAGPWRWCHGRIHRREQPWRGKKPTAPAEPQPGLHMGCLWEQNSQLRQGTFII